MLTDLAYLPDMRIYERLDNIAGSTMSIRQFPTHSFRKMF